MGAKLTASPCPTARPPCCWSSGTKMSKPSELVATSLMGVAGGGEPQLQPPAASSSSARGHRVRIAAKVADVEAGGWRLEAGGWRDGTYKGPVVRVAFTGQPPASSL